MTTARGMETLSHSCHSDFVGSSTPSLAAIKNSAQSAARRPARSSPTKSAYPGVSIRLTLMPSCSRGATARPTDRCCRISASSKSQVVVPSTTDPGLGSTPEATSSASTSVVLPAPDGPTRTTLRMPAGASAVGAAPPPRVVLALSATRFLHGSSLAAGRRYPQFPQDSPSTSTGLLRDDGPMAQRDRDESGNARTARPRDVLGRPLPRGSEGIPRIPDDLDLPPAESLRYAQDLLDRGLAFNAHEVLEAAWKTGPQDERNLWQGLAQLAVGITHIQRGNVKGAITLLRRASARLAHDRPAPYDIDAAGLVTL